MSALASIRHQIQQLDEILAGLNKKALTDKRPSLNAQIRALEREHRVLQGEFERIAATSALDVCRYVIADNNVGTIRGLARVLQEFQDLFSTIYALKKGVPTPKAEKRKVKNREQAERLVPTPEFGFGYSFPGSIGLALTLPVQQNAGLFMVTDDFVVATIESINELTKADTPSGVSELARRIGPSAIEAMYRWTDAHVQFGYGVGIDWRHIDGTDRKIRLQKEELERLRENLGLTTIDERLEIVATLVAVDSDAKEFRLRTDDGTDLTGSYQSAITEEQAASVPARYEAILRKSIRIIPPEGQDESEASYFLLELNRP